jgi:hypothetical protein
MGTTAVLAFDRHGSPASGGGRPDCVDAPHCRTIFGNSCSEMAAENPIWGEARIADELQLKLRTPVSPRTVGRYVATARGPGGIVACDFFVVATATFRFLCLFVIIGNRQTQDLASQRYSPSFSGVDTATVPRGAARRARLRICHSRSRPNLLKRTGSSSTRGWACAYCAHRCAPRGQIVSANAACARYGQSVWTSSFPFRRTTFGARSKSEFLIATTAAHIGALGPGIPRRWRPFRRQTRTVIKFLIGAA